MLTKSSINFTVQLILSAGKRPVTLALGIIYDVFWFNLMSFNAVWGLIGRVYVPVLQFKIQFLIVNSPDNSLSYSIKQHDAKHEKIIGNKRYFFPIAFKGFCLLYLLTYFGYKLKNDCTRHSRAFTCLASKIIDVRN